jgi:capsular polysaccharide biosynthesis protein
MELSDYRAVFRRFIAVILLITVIGAGAGLVFSLLQDVMYDTSISFAVNRTSRQETPDYQYDGYYAIQAADLFSQTIVSWFSTPSVILEMYRKGGIEPVITSIDSFSNQFRTRKYSPQNIVLRYSEATNDRAATLAEAIIAVAKDKVKQLNRSSDQEALFELVASEPVIVEKRPNVALTTVLGAIGGLIVGLLSAVGLSYLRPAQGAEAPARREF